MPNKKIFGRDQNFLGSDRKYIGKIRNFRAVSRKLEVLLQDKVPKLGKTIKV